MLSAAIGLSIDIGFGRRVNIWEISFTLHYQCLSEEMV